MLTWSVPRAKLMLQKSPNFHSLAAENGSVKISPSSCDNVCSIPSVFPPLSLSLFNRTLHTQLKEFMGSQGKLATQISVPWCLYVAVRWFSCFPPVTVFFLVSFVYSVNLWTADNVLSNAAMLPVVSLTCGCGHWQQLPHRNVRFTFTAGKTE